MTGTGLDRSGLDRRTFVIGATAGALVLGTADMASAARVPPKIIDNPFTLGIASGDPLANGVVIWTRLAPDPINRGGMPDARLYRPRRRFPCSWTGAIVVVSGCRDAEGARGHGPWAAVVGAGVSCRSHTTGAGVSLDAEKVWR